MSSKQFISAEEHLAKLDVTEQQALDFILTNIDEPEVIYLAAFENGVTIAMLSEITNISTTVISDYFVAVDLQPEKLDYTSTLINFDLGSLEALVDFNDNVGILSNDSFRNTVRSLVNDPLDYDYSFKPVIPGLQDKDGIYDADELGVGHLTDVPATSENLESLFFGSLINMFNALDETELNQIKAFPADGNQEEFQALIIDALSESPENFSWTDEQLAESVSEYAAEIIEELWNDSPLVGALDHSYLALAAM